MTDATERYKKLTLLHSNDMHGDFLAEKVDDSLIGGVAMLSGYVNKVREEEPNTLYCIAGDMFRGSVIDSEYQGLSTIEIMNALGPDIVTLGNHETDYGLSHLLFIEKCARFPIINSNLYIRTNRVRLFNPFKIFEVDGMKILFIGILTEEVLAQTKNDGIIGSFVTVEEAAREVERICNAYNAIDIDFTVLLTHIGFEEDKKLAAMLDPACGVDVIIGGHSHTFLTEPAEVNGIQIVQAGTGTDQIGRFDIVVDTKNNCIASSSWKTIPISAEYCPINEDIIRVITQFKDVTDAKYNRVITHMNRLLTHPERTQETELGNLFADAMQKSLQTDIFLMGSGSIRNTKLGPLVLYSDLTECFPYDDPVYMIEVTGAQLKGMIRHMVRDEVWEGAHTEFYQLSHGMRVVYHQSSHDFSEFSLNDEPVEDEKYYTVGLQGYHFSNMKDSFNLSIDEVARHKKPRTIATSCAEIIEEYFLTHNNLDSRVEGRLVIHLEGEKA